MYNRAAQVSTATDIMTTTTTQNQDIYISHPAFPILASTLLPPPVIRSTHQAPAEQRTNPIKRTWSLEPSLSNAFCKISRHDNSSSSDSNKSQDSEHLLRCGIVIGLSYLRESGDIGDSYSDSQLTSRNRDLLGDVRMQRNSKRCGGVDY